MHYYYDKSFNDQVVFCCIFNASSENIIFKHLKSSIINKCQQLKLQENFQFELIHLIILITKRSGIIDIFNIVTSSLILSIQTFK